MSANEHASVKHSYSHSYAKQCDLAYISAGATIICYCLARYVMSECEQNVK